MALKLRASLYLWSERFRRSLEAICLALLLFFTEHASAQEGLTPADVVEHSDARLELPPLPAGFVREQTGAVTWEHHASAESLVRDLQAALPELWSRITRELDTKVSDDLVIRIARGPKDMIRLAPKGAPPPAYAVGVAYPARGLIILSVVAPSTWLPPNLDGVLAHELSHIALHRAVKGEPLPLWFVEGTAVHQAREQNITRIRTLWEATVAGGVLPLSQLSRAFPQQPHAVGLAYAQSADLVNFLLRDPEQAVRLGDLLRRVAAGKPFELALLGAYRIDLNELEREWRNSLRERFHIMPLLLSGTAIWTGIGILAVLAFIRRRKQHREKLARWGAEEAAYDRAMRALELSRVTVTQLPNNADDRSELEPITPLSPGETGIPTIEHEGQRYTLH